MWFPQKNENSQRASDHQSQKDPRKKKTNYRVGLSYPKALRILSRRFYKKIYTEGERFCGKTLFLQYHKGNPPTRLGITVTKRYGKAHDRNRFKRLVKESFREFFDNIPSGIQLNVSPRLPSRHLTKSAILNDLKALVKELTKG